MRKNAVDPDTLRTRFACWITMGTDIHSEYVILTDFLRQQWLSERASMLCYSTLQSVYFAVRAEALNTIHVYLRPQSVNGARVSVRLFRIFFFVSSTIKRKGCVHLELAHTGGGSNWLPFGIQT
jgi:hypothetical protein